MLLRAVMDDLDEVDVAQNRGRYQNRPRDLDIVVGQKLDDLQWGILAPSQAFAHLAADPHFNVAQQFAEDVRHQGVLAFVEHAPLFGKKIRDGVEQQPAPFGGLVSCKAEQLIEFAVNIHDDVCPSKAPRSLVRA